MILILTIASLLVVLSVHLNISHANGMTGMEAFKFILSEPSLIKAVGLSYSVCFLMIYGIIYFIFWLFQ